MSDGTRAGVQRDSMAAAQFHAWLPFGASVTVATVALTF